jgi:hypothetical protein
MKQLMNGNMNPGKGNKNIFGSIFEARGSNGGRLYFRNVSEGAIEILGYSGKGNQQTVINRLMTLYK